MTTKSCNNVNCNQTNPQPIEQFFRDKNNKTDGRYSLCKTCKQAKTMLWREKNKEVYNAKMREYQAEHKDTRRDVDLKRTYGVPSGWYEKTLKEQSGCCAICKKENPSSKRTLALDHNHKTGVVRGLLCYGCNRLLVLLDNPELLEAALTYVRKHGAK